MVGELMAFNFVYSPSNLEQLLSKRTVGCEKPCACQCLFFLVFSQHIHTNTYKLFFTTQAFLSYWWNGHGWEELVEWIWVGGIGGKVMGGDGCVARVPF